MCLKNIYILYINRILYTLIYTIRLIWLQLHHQQLSWEIHPGTFGRRMLRCAVLARISFLSSVRWVAKPRINAINLRFGDRPGHLYIRIYIYIIGKIVESFLYWVYMGLPGYINQHVIGGRSGRWSLGLFSHCGLSSRLELPEAFWLGNRIKAPLQPL